MPSTTRGQLKKKKSSIEDDGTTMEVDPPTDSDQNTNSSTTNDKPEDMMEDGEDSSSKENSLLGKRGTDKDKEEIRSSEDEPSSKQAKMELRTRTKKNYSEENFATDDGVLQVLDKDWAESGTKSTKKKEEWVPRVEKILAHRYNDKGEIEYYVKWKNKSYLHVSWVGPDEFSHERYSKRKLIRYHKKDETLYDENDELFNSAFLEIDRIVGKFENEDGLSYLVKWDQMSYTEITWEWADDISDDTKIKEYNKRQIPPSPKSWKSKPRPSPSEWKEYKESPEYKDGNSLRSYQLEGLNWLTFCWYNNRNSILADEMGLGKTVQTVAVLNHLYSELDMHGPFLIVAPLITVPHWQREFESWTDMNVVVYHGTAAAREIIRQYEWNYDSLKGSPPPYKFNVLITTYEMVLTDSAILSKIHWKYLAVDEAHRLKNTKCKLINALRLFNFDHLLLLTGTPLQNNTEELWTLLNFMDPEKFASSEEFSFHFGDLKETSQVEQLHEVLRPYLLRRMKEDVEKTIAPKEETIVEVELTTIQKSYYRAIFERNFTSLNMGAKSSNVPSLLNIMMQLRKCCNHPYLLRGVEENIVKHTTTEDENELMINSCGKLVLVDKLLAKLKEGGHKVLIFSQMIRMLDILEDYLIHKKYPYERIDGNKRGNERQEAIDRFSAPDSDRFVFLLCTRAGGLGINLTAADTCIIYDSDWNPQNDIQAQARCHRIGQTQKVKIYRLLTRNTYETLMFKKASLKLGLDQVVLTKMKQSSTPNANSTNTSANMNMTTNAALRAMDRKEIEELLRHGAYKTFTEGNSNEKFDEEDIDQILERNSTTIIHDSTTNSVKPLSSFSKASFISANAESNADLDVTDPDFWKKLLPGEHSSKSGSGRNNESDDSEKPRYSLRETTDRFPLYDPYMSSDEEGGDDDDDDNFDFGNGTNWTSRERAKVKATLPYYGYGQWEAIKEVGGLSRWTISQIQAYADALIMNCVTQISEDPHSLLKFLQKWSIYDSKQKGDDKFDFSFDPSLTDPNFSLYKRSNAKPFVRKLENIAKVCKAVIQCYKENGEKLVVPHIPGEKPCSSWTTEDDRSLILGTYYHGYGRYEKMRTDERLSFTRFALDSEKEDSEKQPSLDNLDMEDIDVNPAHPLEDVKMKEIDDNDEEKKVKEEEEEEEEKQIKKMEEEEEEDNSLEIWPAEKKLHQQLRKVLRLLTFDEDTYVPDPKDEEVEEKIDIEDEIDFQKKKRYFSSSEWSKREKQAIYRYIVAFGIPEDNDEDGWNDFKQVASLTRKAIPQIQIYCKALADTAEVRTDKDRTELSEDWSTQIDGDLTLTAAQSKRLVQRIRIFKDIRNFLLPRVEELPKLLESAAITSLPKWWKPVEHDYALIHGIMKHGFGQWEKVCSDPELPFLSIANNRMKSEKVFKLETPQSVTDESKKEQSEVNDDNNINNDDNDDDEKNEQVKEKSEAAEAIDSLRESTAGDMDSDSEDDEDGNSGSRRKRGRKADIYTTAVSFPKEKAILKRIRYLIKFINEANLPPVEKGSSKPFPKRAPIKLSTDSLTTTTTPTNSESPRSSRKHKICAGRKPAKKKYHEIPLNDDGSPIFPIVFGKMRVECLGEIDAERPNYHNDRYIWPVGFRSVRPYQSFVDPSSRTEYTSEIVDGGERPLFQVTASDAPDKPGQGNSPTAAWTAILRKLNEKSNKPFNAVSGPEYFGLAKGIISKLIQELPNADKCFNYQTQEFILDKTPQTRKKRKSKSFAESPQQNKLMNSQGSPISIGNPLHSSVGSLDGSETTFIHSSVDPQRSMQFTMIQPFGTFTSAITNTTPPPQGGVPMHFSSPVLQAPILPTVPTVDPFTPTTLYSGIIPTQEDPSLQNLPPMPIQSESLHNITPQDTNNNNDDTNNTNNLPPPLP